VAAEGGETGGDEYPEQVDALALGGKQPEGEEGSEREGTDGNAGHRVVVDALGPPHREDAGETAEQEGDRHLQRLQRIVGDRVAGVRHIEAREGRQDSQQRGDGNSQAAIKKRRY